MTGRSLLAGSVLSLLAVTSCSMRGNEESSTKQASNAITEGDADSGDPGVVAIGPRRVDCDDSVAPFCSGVLIAPRVVLTAAHCFTSQRPGQPYEVFFGSDVTLPGEVHGVTRVVMPSAYDGGNGGGDLALVILDSAATPTPVMLGTVAATDVGKSVTVAGFGVTEDGGGVGTKRSGIATIQSVEADTFRITPAPAMSCDGDSGGPIFLHGSTGNALIGVTSFGDPGCTTFAENARVDVYQTSFIDSVVAGSADEGGAMVDPAANPPKNVCSGSCTSAAQCGDGFDCPQSDNGTGQCTLSGLPAGDFGARCSTGNDCASNLCARLGSAPTSCLCLTLCQPPNPDSDAAVGPAPSTTSDANRGCSCRSAENSRGSSAASAVIGVLVLSVGGAARRRRRLTLPHPRL